MFEIILSEGINQNIYFFYLINEGLKNSLFNFIMPLITNFGGFFGWSIICLIVYLFGGRFGRQVAVLGFAALILSNILVILLKTVVAEPRPYLAMSNVDLLTTESGSSFPSGHTASSFVTAIVIGLKYHKKTSGKKHLLIYLMLIFAVIVGFSRIYVGVHYPYDVISGALLGVVCALIILKFENSILYSKVAHIIHMDKVLAFDPLGKLMRKFNRKTK
ncbi:MAG TPA: phosphatase PAP2 family protein [Methanobacterium sp.]|jgi:undecaprenyl-diphosphatase|nr:MAG: phosphatase PAP2 family protein [Methanobacterium sp.]HOI70693.1 phosphatase PAP2 family protein [Methanobacterium sp.]HPX78424.1 phosphatase PAP2 family protein [Methanobacterium sp.]